MPINESKTYDNGIVIINCRSNEINNEYLPFPNDSKTPEITIPKVDIIKHGARILNPIIPISNNELDALNQDKIRLGKARKIIEPLHKITKITTIETLIISITRLKCLAPKL